MTEHGWDADEWPAPLLPRVLAADILVIAGPIWLGDNSSVTRGVIEQLYGYSAVLNGHGQYAYYGRVGGCLINGNEDGLKHCAMSILYNLQHIGFTVPPQADAGWLGEVGPGHARREVRSRVFAQVRTGGSRETRTHNLRVKVVIPE
jgi:multimeric flavodoxin WrbA